jgi:hypothetical protein
MATSRLSRRAITQAYAALAVAVATSVVGCAGGWGAHADGSSDRVDRGAVGTVHEDVAWSSIEDPLRLDATYVRNIGQMPVKGTANPVPSLGWYWPTSQDSIAARWAGPDIPSPAEKYEAAFSHWGFTKIVEQKLGSLSKTDAPKCTKDGDCDFGSSCAYAIGATGGFCIADWEGICNGWAAYGVTEGAPWQRPVERNGVVFQPADLVALFSVLYLDIGYRTLGSRCNEDLNDIAIYGPRTDACKDLTPGAFHVVMANMMGLRGKAFIVDDSIDFEVWNRPYFAFQVINAQNGNLYEISKQTAITLTMDTAQWNTLSSGLPVRASKTLEGDATVDADGTYVVRVHGDNTMLLSTNKTASGDVCLQADGAGADFSAYCVVQLKKGETVHWKVTSSGSTTSLVEIQAGPPSLQDYTPNPLATRFFWVQTDITKIENRSPTPAAGDVTSGQTITTFYYVLEASDDGTIIGGEWVGPSLLHRPDFIWIPVTKPTTTLDGWLRYDEVSSLAQSAAGDTEDFTMLDINPAVVGMNGTALPTPFGPLRDTPDAGY